MMRLNKQLSTKLEQILRSVIPFNYFKEYKLSVVRDCKNGYNRNTGKVMPEK